MVLCLGAPKLALNLRRSFFVRKVAYHATGLKLSQSTPAKPQGQASVAKKSSSRAHDAVTGKTIGLGVSENNACSHQRATRKRRQ